jgi:hypothetical protein
LLATTWDKNYLADLSEGIPTALKAAIDLLTKILQCVKVHLSNAPWVYFEHYSFGLAFASQLALLFQDQPAGDINLNSKLTQISA